MFHVELRQFPSSVRRFNLTREQLDERIIVPWLAGESIELDGRGYQPEKAKLKVIEGPELRTDEIGMGRGWANAARAGEDITERLLAEVRAVAAPSAQDALVEEFKAAVLAACAADPAGRLPLREVAALAGAWHPRSRVSEQLALAERAVWELLHHGRVELHAPSEGDAVPREGWQPVVLAWPSWSGGASISARSSGDD